MASPHDDYGVEEAPRVDSEAGEQGGGVDVARVLHGDAVSARHVIAHRVFLLRGRFCRED